jgi:hypothetical protein
MSTHNYRASFAMIGLVLLAGISASPVLAGKPNVANTSQLPLYLIKTKSHQQKQVIAIITLLLLLGR